MKKPVRLQLSRKAGFDLQALSKATNGLEAVNCARPGKWGNPFKVTKTQTVELAVRNYKSWLHRAFRVRGAEFHFGRPPEDFSDLRGKNLACYCKPGACCHADVLLEIANK